MTNGTGTDKEKSDIEAELYQFNTDQVNKFIRFYNYYGHRLYLLEKGLDVDSDYYQTVEQFPEGHLICESMEEIEYVRNQFKKLCEANMNMLKEYVEQTDTSKTMVAFMKALMNLGKREQRIRITNVEFL